MYLHMKRAQQSHIVMSTVIQPNVKTTQNKTDSVQIRPFPF